MGNPLRDGRPVSTRDHRSGPAFEQWKLDRAAEIAEEQRQQAEAQAAAEAADPVLAFQKASDAEAQAIRELILTGYVPDSILAVERINGRRIVESAKINNWKYFAENTPTFKRWMAEQLIDTAFRSDIAPIAPAYLALHNLMLQYGAYVEPVQEVAPAVEEPAQQVLTPSELAVLKHQDYMTKIVGVDEMGREWTDEAIDRELSAKDGLRLRRLFEKGHRGDSLMDQFHEVKDAQAVRDAEIARRGAEEGR